MWYPSAEVSNIWHPMWPELITIQCFNGIQILHDDSGDGQHGTTFDMSKNFAAIKTRGNPFL